MTNRSFDPFIMEKRIYDLEQSGGGGVPQELIDKVNKNTADIANLDGDIVDLSGDVEANTSAISTLDGKVTTLDGSVTTLDGNVTAMDSRVTQNTTDIGINTTAISTLNSNLTTENSVAFKFCYDTESGKYGYKDGADTFCPFSEYDIIRGSCTVNGKDYIDTDRNIVCLFAYKNTSSTTLLYDSNYSASKYKQNVGSSYAWLDIKSTTTTDDTIGKDDTGFYIYHSDMKNHGYLYIAIVE